MTDDKKHLTHTSELYFENKKQQNANEKVQHF
jgi:hypothetical protein